MIAKVADHYVLHTPEQQRDILKQMVSRVVINLEGRIVRIELQPPFNYLDGLHHKRESDPDGQCPGPQNGKTDTPGAGSLPIIFGDPERMQFEQVFASISSIPFLQLIAFPQRPFLERFTNQS